eukprot:TRINITY_DN16459_c0_g1_i1.p1 TRINITY_DN16459_c0_g1~~TRINITY_DN16459_c0_g1_i1.p1  ORF type:complete len:210 (-),score=75.18 TRINITY_DN16459_c0_g1_i1:141-770(-)
MILKNKKLQMTVVDDLINLYNTKGKEYHEDNINQLEHALQCGILAENHYKKSDDEEEKKSDEFIAKVICASLFHDIGQLVVDENRENENFLQMDREHEKVGEEYLKGLGFDEIVSTPVLLHVNAKRFLCAVDSDYYDTLSNVSKGTLELQGGIYTEEQVEEFKKIPHYDLGVLIRTFDDIGKEVEPEFEVPESIDYFRHYITLAYESSQ